MSLMRVVLAAFAMSFLLLLSARAAAAGPTLSFTRAMPALATRALARYHDADRRKYLDTRFRLELVARRYQEAERTLTQLRAYENPRYPHSATNYSQFSIYVRAEQLRSAGLAPDRALQQAFYEYVTPLDDVRAAYVIWRFIVLGDLEGSVKTDLSAQGDRPTIPLPQAVALLRDYQLAQMYRTFSPVANRLISDDDHRRYVIQPDILIPTPDGRAVCSFVMRPRAQRRMPALLEYSIYADERIVYQDPRLSAAHGYAGVGAYTPGKACGSGPIIPYVNEGMHADAVIKWISRQPWSDGRVGMFGGSYNGFAAWAAAKHAPAALKALMTGVTNAPGVDTPMERNVFETWVYPWPFYVTAGKWLDAGSEPAPFDLSTVQSRWYVSGTSYRGLDEISGSHSPVWSAFLTHPSYDAFWQSLIPYRNDFARIHLPVLITDGYLSGQNVGGFYYFSQYRRFDPTAETYLVLGPYDHLAGQFGTTAIAGADHEQIAGYDIDPIAKIDMVDLRYQWFDHIFKRAARPAILANTINYEVMHGNHWEHAASVDAMHGQNLRIDFSPGVQSVDYADRSDVNRTPPASGVDAYLGKTFSSAPLRRAAEFNGVLSGRLNVACNKYDFDFEIDVYQELPDGAYEFITDDLGRASYVGHPEVRTLLKPSKPTSLAFQGSRITAWKLSKGSRIVVVLRIVKDPGLEINYGAAKHVADESIADAASPLVVHWLAGGFVTIPLRALP